ncbi:hypothetical protein NDU88_005874, partial [Pleurodeles waltl]
MTCAANNICGRDPPPGSPGQASHPQSSPAIHSAFIEYAVFPGAYDPLLTCPIAKTELWGQNLSAPGISAARWAAAATRLLYRAFSLTLCCFPRAGRRDPKWRPSPSIQWVGAPSRINRPIHSWPCLS